MNEVQKEMLPTQRATVPEMDAILGKCFSTLNGQGFVRVIDYMGSDSAIVQAARVSYGVGTKKVSEDAALIDYLIRHRHTSPLEMCELKLHIRVPMDCWRQWIRHRTASVNEYSTRYSMAIHECQTTPPDQWRMQATDNKQGSSGFLPAIDEEGIDVGQHFSVQEACLHSVARDTYKERIKAGIAREQARKDLPLSTFTESYWKIDLHNLLHFLALRMDSHAQKEIREYATIIGEQIVAQWVPAVWTSFQDHVLNSVHFSATEIEVLQKVISCISDTPVLTPEVMLEIFQPKLGKRKMEEVRSKLKVLGIAAPEQP